MDAAPPPAERAEVFSIYERETIGAALDARRLRRDSSPEGKIIEGIDVVPLDVVEPRDPLPLSLNWFHATTRPFVVRREMLLVEGDRYQQVLVDETIRNLRRLLQLSLVLVVAAEGSAPDRVRVVVLTKDVWSLRLNWNAVVTPGGIELAHARPSEINLFGTHQTLRADIVYDPRTWAIGAGYVVPRIGDSRVALTASADVVVNQTTGSPEGSFGSVVAGQPLYSALDRWAWDSTVAWSDRVQRRFENARLALFKSPTTGNLLPEEYRERVYTLRPEVTRSFGWDNKNDVTAAFLVDRRTYATDFHDVDFEATRVPVSDTRVGPSLQWHAYTKRYVRVIDFDTLALQEDYRLGHDVVVIVQPSFRAIGSTRNVLSLHAAAQYTWAIRDGVFRVAVSSLTEPEADRIADGSLEPAARLATPTIARFGRLVVDGTLLWRWRDHLNQRTIVGGDGRLRGYPTNFFLGKNAVAYNVEFRTRPVEVLSTMQLGGVAFFDAGGAADSLDRLRPFQSVGVGLRSLFPQLDRIVFRVDVGFPLVRPIDPSTGAPIPPFGFLASFGQAFGTPSVSPAPVLPTGQ